MTLLPTGCLAMIRDILVVTTVWGATGIQWVGAREAAKHPTMHRTAVPTKNYLAPNVKLWLLRNSGVN